MKVTYEGEVISNLKHRDGSFSSNVEWKTGNYSHSSIYVGFQWPLGSKVNVTLELVEPQEPVENLDDPANPM